MMTTIEGGITSITMDQISFCFVKSVVIFWAEDHIEIFKKNPGEPGLVATVRQTRDG